jgi:hypothetical protein
LVALGSWLHEEPAGKRSRNLTPGQIIKPGI